MTSHRDITIPTDTPAQPLLSGGYNIPNIPLYCDLCFLRPILDYVKHRLDFTPAAAQNAMVEFNIGHQLSRLLDFPFKNFVPHTARPSFFYAHALALIKKYKLTSEQIDKSSLHQLHRLLTPIPRPHFVNRQMWHSIHSTVLTNTHRTFNYRSIFEILPLLTKNTHHTWTPDLHAAFVENYQKSLHTFSFHAAKLHRFGILLNPS